jgi:hypothetical protein
MLIFIDTEFTDFKNAELISIALVPEDGRQEFYAELPVNLCKCSEFVLETVVPQLGKVANARCTAPVTICFDFAGDWQLFCEVLKSDIPTWLSGRNINRHIDQVALKMFFIEYDLRDHHALNDAKANRHAYDRNADNTGDSTNVGNN